MATLKSSRLDYALSRPYRFWRALPLATIDAASLPERIPEIEVLPIEALHPQNANPAKLERAFPGTHSRLLGSAWAAVQFLGPYIPPGRTSAPSRSTL